MTSILEGRVPAEAGRMTEVTPFLSDADRRLDSGTRWVLPAVVGGLALLGLLWLLGRNRTNDIQTMASESVNSAGGVNRLMADTDQSQR